jgi:hypothetical protein
MSEWWDATTGRACMFSRQELRSCEASLL